MLLLDVVVACCWWWLFLLLLLLLLLLLPLLHQQFCCDVFFSRNTDSRDGGERGGGVTFSLLFYLAVYSYCLIDGGISVINEICVITISSRCCQLHCVVSNVRVYANWSRMRLCVLQDS